MLWEVGFCLLSHRFQPLIHIKVERKERRVFSAEDAASFLIACANMPQGLIFEFSVMTGMRNQEYLALQWQDLDIERGTITVQRALEYHKGVWRFKEPKTALARRCLPLPIPLIVKLQEHRLKQEQKKQKAGSLWKDHQLIFCSEIGTPLQYPKLTYRYFQPILAAAGLPKIRLYDLRHSHASLLLAADENLKVVSERLGHSSIRLTADVYSHVSLGLQRGATEKLTTLLYNTKTSRFK